jgi:hypothetical protein
MHPRASAWMRALVCVFAIGLTQPAFAQFIGDAPPPVPPANVPQVPTPSGAAISLAPPSGPAMWCSPWGQAT